MPFAIILYPGLFIPLLSPFCRLSSNSENLLSVFLCYAIFYSEVTMKDAERSNLKKLKGKKYYEGFLY